MIWVEKQLLGRMKWVKVFKNAPELGYLYLAYMMSTDEVSMISRNMRRFRVQLEC
jgi:hypothetical protein